MHLLEYNKNYKKATGSLWNYYRDQPSDPLFSNSESFKYETSITGNTYNIDEKITNYDGNEVILNMVQMKLMKLMLLFH